MYQHFSHRVQKHSVLLLRYDIAKLDVPSMLKVS